MNEAEEIERLRRELEELQAGFEEQQRKLNALRARLNLLSGQAPLPLERRTGPRSTFSLENFIGLRLIHIIGIVVLVIGLSIGVKYAIDRNLISEVLRIALAYGAGIALYFLSFRLRKNYGAFSAILFSGAMASLYFTTYAAFTYYAMFPFAIAFLLMVLLTIYAVLEAIRYGRQEIALLGLVGAYGIPFLISKNSENAELFFIYITLINLGAGFLSIKKLWRQTGLAAQLVTWLLFIAWALERYTDQWKMTALLFMWLFFLLFLFMVAAFKLRHRKPWLRSDAYQLLFNNLALYLGALFVFGLPEHPDSELAMITLAASALTAVQSIAVSFYWRAEVLTIRLLSTLALTDFILFIAFNWDGFTVTLLWLVTSVLIFAYGILRQSVRARMAGMVLVGVTLAKLLALDSLSFSAVQKVIAYLSIGVLLLVASFFYQKFRAQLFKEEGHDETKTS